MINYKDAFNSKNHDENVEVVEPEHNTQEETENFVVKVITKKLNLRFEPNKDSKALKILNEGDELIAQAIEDDAWYKVYTEAGIEGYVMREFVE